MNAPIDVSGAREEEIAPVRAATGSAKQLVAAMPRLILEARRAAASVFHGLHGRRRAGPGENFWQYRRFNDGEPSNRVDWRRSARDDHLYVREREWEASHTVWIWPDLSPSMIFASPLVWETKRDRALVLAFALGELLVQGGERVAIPGLMRPSANRNVIERMAEAIIHHGGEWQSLPPPITPGPREEIVLLSDLWSPAREIIAAVDHMAKRGPGGHVVQIVDPAEETFPYSGRIDFREPETGQNLMVGRAEMWARDYLDLVAKHRDLIRNETTPRGWSFAIHRTDRPASELLISLHARMGEARDVISRKRASVKLGETEAA
jgi:uncharacterized protein (DUF58 family)